MELKEFNDLVLSFVDSDFPQRDIPLIFNQSIRLQINEIDSDRHYKMQFYEFLEAFCRAVDKASPPPLGAPPVKKNLFLGGLANGKKKRSAFIS